MSVTVISLGNPRHQFVPNTDQVDAVMAYAAVKPSNDESVWFGYVPGHLGRVHGATHTEALSKLRESVRGCFARCVAAIRQIEETGGVPPLQGVRA